MSNVMPTAQPKRRFTPLRWVAIVLAGLLVATLAWKTLGPRLQGPAPETVAPAHASPTLHLTAHGPYQFLRDAQLMGHHFVMLRHQHTAQRVVLLTGDPQASEAYAALFQQDLSTLQFMLLIQVFKSQSSFEGKDIQVTEAHRIKSGTLSSPTGPLPYKAYRVSTLVEGRPQTFEADLVQLRQGRTTHGLAFTFNSEHALATEALTDLPTLFQPTAP